MKESQTELNCYNCCVKLNSGWFILNRTGVNVWSGDINPNQLHIFEVNRFSSAREVSATILFSRYLNYRLTIKKMRNCF
jgi:hypothetical protein